ncbi:MAG: glycosyltransferase [Flavobacteriales bacterium]
MNENHNGQPHLYTDRRMNVISEYGFISEKRRGIIPEILVITTFPPVQCGIASYSHDLVGFLNKKFNQSFSVEVCAIEQTEQEHDYTDRVKSLLHINRPNALTVLAESINDNDNIQLVVIQHEFGLFMGHESELELFLSKLEKPSLIVFHTVLAQPNEELHKHIQKILDVVDSVIVMTNSSLEIIENNYFVSADKVHVIPHGTHLIRHMNKEVIKEKYHLKENIVLSNFGLLSSGKSIETTLHALPQLIQVHPNIIFLIIGKTHPTVIEQQAETYREGLYDIVQSLGIEKNVRFIDRFLPLRELLEYLQLTDIYMFTSNNPNQSVSGTFSYALSCGCPVISTPIPHAMEVLSNGAGVIVPFNDSLKLAQEALLLLEDQATMADMVSLQREANAVTAWENSAIAHALIFEQMMQTNKPLIFNVQDISLGHLKRMTTSRGMLQFSVYDEPDFLSGYTLDDNARALLVAVEHYSLTREEDDIGLIDIYLGFIESCYTSSGMILNYINYSGEYTDQNYRENLEDARGRAIWALGKTVLHYKELPIDIIRKADYLMKRFADTILKISSPRAMSFTIKGLCFYIDYRREEEYLTIIQIFSDRLVKLYLDESDEGWKWFEGYLTYANSVLPEALLRASEATGIQLYRKVAHSTFSFLLSIIYKKNKLNVVSNVNWLKREELNTQRLEGAEQSVDVAYTILALEYFHQQFPDEQYDIVMSRAFDWYNGANHLSQIIYNPCTGGCYDGLEPGNVNLNQGAESTLCYLLSRFAVERVTRRRKRLQRQTAYTKVRKSEYVQMESRKDVSNS